MQFFSAPIDLNAAKTLLNSFYVPAADGKSNSYKAEFIGDAAAGFNTVEEGTYRVRLTSTTSEGN